MKDLKGRFEELVQGYIIAFEEKHEIGFDYWIADQVGEVADFNSYCIHFDDMRRDIDEDIPKDVFFEWHDHNFDTDTSEENYINYRTWLMNYGNNLNKG